MPSVKPAVMTTNGTFMRPIAAGDVLGTDFLPMTELLQTVYNEFDSYLQEVITDPTTNPDFPNLMAELLISVQANNGIVKGTDGNLYIDLKAINDRIDNVTSVIHIVGMSDTLPAASGYNEGDAYIKTNDADNGGRSWLYILVNGAWAAEGPFELNMDNYATDQELSDAVANLRAELEQALAPANITLNDETASDILPVIGSTNTQVALQTTRNILKWLKDQVNSKLTDANLNDIRSSIAANAAAIATKQNTITGAVSPFVTANATASRALVTDAAGKMAAHTATTSAQVGYLSTLTGDVQTQLNAKQATVTGAATSVVSADLPASRALISDTTGKIAPAGSVSSTQLGYLSGVTSSIQTQLNTALTEATTTTAGRVRILTAAEAQAAIN